MASKEKGTLIKDAIILFAITLIAALALGFVYEITKDPIAEAKLAAKVAAYQAVFPELSDTKEDEAITSAVEASAEYIEQFPELVGSSVNEVLIAVDASGEELGYVMTVTNGKGYGGDIQFAMGVTKDGILKGVQFLSISETAGLGMKAKDDAFLSQFKDVEVSQYAFTKEKIPGDVEIDAISGATITSRAVTRGINAGLKFAAHLEGNE